MKARFRSDGGVANPRNINQDLARIYNAGWLDFSLSFVPLRAKHYSTTLGRQNTLAGGIANE
jgi:hypothetical protein